MIDLLAIIGSVGVFTLIVLCGYSIFDILYWKYIEWKYDNNED